MKAAAASSLNSGGLIRRLLPYFLVFLVSVLVFSNSLWGAFCFDDAFALLYNGDVHHKENSMREIFFHDFWGHDITKPDSHKSYRPLTTISFRLNYLSFLFFGGNETRPSHIPEEHNGSTWQPQNFLIGLHAVNVILHAATSCYVYKLAKDLFLYSRPSLLPDHSRSNSAFSAVWEDIIPFLGGLIFATHPVHVEAVASIVGRAEMLSALLCLLGFDIWRHRKSWFSTILAIALVYASVLCKEITFAMYGVFIVWDTLKFLNSAILRTQPYQMGLSARNQTPTKNSANAPKDQKNRPKATGKTGDKTSKEGNGTGAGTGAQAGESVDEKDILSSSQSLPGSTSSSTTLSYEPAELDVAGEALEEIDEGEEDEIRDSEEVDVHDAPTAGSSTQEAHSRKNSGFKKNKKGKGGPSAAPSGLQPSNVLYHLPRLRTSGHGVPHQPYAPSSSSTHVNSSKLPSFPGLSKSAPGFYHRSGYGRIASSFFIWRSKVLASLPSYLPKWVPLFLENTLLSPWFVGRTALTLVTIALYLQMRRTLMGDSMVVQNYRRVENPLAYIESKLNLVLSAAYLHANYLWILIYPVQLSCDWSFNCIHLIESILDEANIFSLGAYLMVIIPAVWSIVSIFRANRHALPVLFCVFWGVLFFLPASNLFFFVGTMLAERVLYLPSITFCIIIPMALDRALSIFMPSSTSTMLVSPQYTSPTSTPPPSPHGTQQETPPNSPNLKQISRSDSVAKSRLLIVSAICILMVASYSHRTWTRNVDWTDNQHLFEAAEQVCPNSAKVHFNLGILRTQQKNFTQSAYHFKRTLEIEPNYCEVAYRRALMHLGQSSYQLGVADLHESLNCIYTRADGATALFKVYQAFINADPANANKYAEQWNAVLKKLEPIIQEEKEGKRPIRQG